jgi:hypothetical protein
VIEDKLKIGIGFLFESIPSSYVLYKPPPTLALLVTSHTGLHLFSHGGILAQFHTPPLMVAPLAHWVHPFNEAAHCFLSPPRFCTILKIMAKAALFLFCQLGGTKYDKHKLLPFSRAWLVHPCCYIYYRYHLFTARDTHPSEYRFIFLLVGGLCDMTRVTAQMYKMARPRPKVKQTLSR